MCAFCAVARRGMGRVKRRQKDVHEKGDSGLIFFYFCFSTHEIGHSHRRLVQMCKRKTANRAFHRTFSFFVWFLMLSYVGVGHGWRLQNIFFRSCTNPISRWKFYFLRSSKYLHHKEKRKMRLDGKGKKWIKCKKCFAFLPFAPVKETAEETC